MSERPLLLRIIRKRDLPACTGLQRTAIEELVKRGEFPKPIPLSDTGRAIGWVEDEVITWQRNRLARRDLNRSQPANPTRQHQRNSKNGNGKTIVIPGEGDPCPRCGVPMQIREHNGVGEKQLRQPFYYKRWFRCMNRSCKTRGVTSERYKVFARPDNSTDDE